MTKLDGTTKGGIVFAISDELGLPVRFVGTGEGEDDLNPFDAEAFVEALFECSRNNLKTNLDRRCCKTRFNGGSPSKPSG